MSVTNDYLEALYKDLHKAELDRSDKLDSQINLPTVIVTVLLGASGLFFERLPPLTVGLKVIAFYIILFCYVTCVCIAIYCMVRSYTKYEYAILPSPPGIQQRACQLREHYRAFYEEKYGSFFADMNPAADDDTKRVLQEEIIDFYKRATAENRRNNITRIRWMFFTTIWIIASLCFLLVSRVLFHSIDNPRPQKVQIVSTASVPIAVNVSGVHPPPTAQKVDIVSAPNPHQVEVVNRPKVNQVETIGNPPVQRIEIIQPLPPRTK